VKLRSVAIENFRGIEHLRFQLLNLEQTPRELTCIVGANGSGKARRRRTPRALAPLRELLTAARTHYEGIRGQMISLQEELDWHCYELYGLVTGHWSRVPKQMTKDK
jgi:hypothetical protein